jgi:predicted HTH transcriptional regulator
MDQPTGSTTTMNRRIFTLGLAVETTSAYLLCCALVDMGKAITTRNLQEVWNGSAEQLRHSLEQLVSRGVLRRLVSDCEGNDGFQLQPVDQWRGA